MFQNPVIQIHHDSNAYQIRCFIWQVEMMDTMKDEQLKEYLYNRPNELKTVKIQKSKPRQRVRYNVFFVDQNGKYEFHFS